MMSTSTAITTQGRVLYALILREIHTINGHSRLGYLWVLFQNIFFIGFFVTVREFMNFHAPHGMTNIMFLFSGFLVWKIFAEIVTKSLSAISGNRALLTYPQVTPLDIMISRMIVIWATQIICACILYYIAHIMGKSSAINNLSGFYFVLLTLPFFALGCGSFLASLCYYIPMLEKLIPMVLRIMFFTSGVFFSVSSLPTYIQEILFYNPIVHYIEWFRMSFSYSFINTRLDIEYTIFIALILLTLGLLLERHVRGRVRI